MHARLNYRQIDADKMDEAICIFRDSTMPERKTHKGFVGGYVLTDRSAGKLIAMTLWETEADTIAAPPPGYVNAIGGEPVVRESYEVSIDYRAESAGGRPAYAKVNYRQFDADKMDEAIRIFRDSTMPEMKTRKGFAGGLVLIDRSAHKLIAMILWDAGKDMSTSEHPGYVNALGGEPPVRESYDVSLQV